MGRKQLLILAACCILSYPFSAPAETHNVTIGDNFFRPNDLTITVGDTVQWNYSGNRQHDATADDFSWRSPTSSSIDFSQTFNSVEEVLYHCTVHSSPGQNINTRMNGRINVTQAVENQPPEANFSFSCADLDCEFTDLSSDSDGTVSSWSWNFDDGGVSGDQNPVHSYAASGTYSVVLTATDDDGAEDSIDMNVTVSDPPPEPVVINFGMSDAWFNKATNGQGMLIMVWEDIGVIFMAWFTFDTERPPEDVTAILGDAGQRWLTAQGIYAGDTATLDVFLSTGGIFNSEETPIFTDPDPIGTVTIKWITCNEAILTYDIPSLGLMGSIEIMRAVPSNNLFCLAGQEME
jgi:PKD repeat protein